jgi:hypothetical protein
MQANIKAIRAITAEFAQEFVRPFVWISLGVIITLVIIVGLLAYFISGWWLLLLVPIILIALIGTAIWLAAQFTLKTLAPKMNVQQKNETKNFVTKLQFAVETLQTPYPIIIFYVIRDIVLRRDSGFISQVTQHSRALKPDFEELKRLF